MASPTVIQIFTRAKKAKLSLRDLSRESGVPYSTITQIKYGVRPNPTIVTIDKLTDALDRIEHRQYQAQYRKTQKRLHPRV